MKNVIRTMPEKQSAKGALIVLFHSKRKEILVTVG
jgi:hypothetical protein